jgi:plasmid stabilization system protein ParE
VAKILDAVESLARMPHKAPVIATIEGIELRGLLVTPYRVVYRLKDDRVVILAVIHAARDLLGALQGRPLS